MRPPAPCSRASQHPELAAVSPGSHPAPGLSCRGEGKGPTSPRQFFRLSGCCSSQPGLGQPAGAFAGGSHQPDDFNPSRLRCLSQRPAPVTASGEAALVPCQPAVNTRRPHASRGLWQTLLLFLTHRQTAAASSRSSQGTPARLLVRSFASCLSFPIWKARKIKFPKQTGYENGSGVSRGSSTAWEGDCRHRWERRGARHPGCGQKVAWPRCSEPVRRANPSIAAVPCSSLLPRALSTERSVRARPSHHSARCRPAPAATTAVAPSLVPPNPGDGAPCTGEMGKRHPTAASCPSTRAPWVTRPGQHGTLPHPGLGPSAGSPESARIRNLQERPGAGRRWRMSAGAAAPRVSRSRVERGKRCCPGAQPACSWRLGSALNSP